MNCKPAYRGSRRMATPGEAKAAEQGYADFPLFIGPDSASYRVGWLDAQRHAELVEEARRERIENARAEYPFWTMR